MSVVLFYFIAGWRRVDEIQSNKIAIVIIFLANKDLNEWVAIFHLIYII